MSDTDVVLEARRALSAAYLMMPEDVALDLNRKVQAAFVALTRTPLPAPVVALDEWRVVDKDGRITDGDTYSREEADAVADDYNTSFSESAPHRVMRVCLMEVPAGA